MVVRMTVTYEELANVVGTLGSETLGDGGVSETGEVLLTLLDNGDGEDRHVGTDNATADGLALTLTGAAGAVARVTLGQQEADTGGEEDTLLHGETLLVVTSGDTENVTLELVAERVDGDLSRDALIVKDATVQSSGKVIPRMSVHSSKPLSEAPMGCCLSRIVEGQDIERASESPVAQETLISPFERSLPVLFFRIFCFQMSMN